MSELKAYKIYTPMDDVATGVMESNSITIEGKEVYLKSEADKVIAELKADKAQAEDDAAFWKTKYEQLKAENERSRKIAKGNVEDLLNDNERLKNENERLKAEMKATKRSLWLMRAERARECAGSYLVVARIYENDSEYYKLRIERSNKWDYVEFLCRLKAEECK